MVITSLSFPHYVGGVSLASVAAIPVVAQSNDQRLGIIPLPSSFLSKTTSLIHQIFSIASDVRHRFVVGGSVRWPWLLVYVVSLAIKLSTDATTAFLVSLIPKI
ncbi:hypothetical protein V6N13_039996 [Hibiscus sabdariffa]